ncbi:MAG TPA: DinB family protein [Thermomicrobiales bacterium]
MSNDDLIFTTPPPSIVSCDPVPGFSPRIGRYVAQLAETRQELLRQTVSLTPDQLSWYPNEQVESIGTQLLHVAAIEWSWIFEDVFGRPGEEYDGWEEALPLRLGLPQVRDRPLAYFTDRLDRVREEALAVLRGLTDDDLSRLVPVAPAEPVTEVFTVDWVLFHLVHHEAHHAGQVELLVRLLPPDLAT